MQSRDQWKRELIAYGNEYGEDEKEVRILALGGIHGEIDETLEHEWMSAEASRGPVQARANGLSCRIHMCLWSRILEQCQKMERELMGMEYPTSQSFAHRRIIRDLIDLFACHGFQTGIWFEETLRHRPGLEGSVEASLLVFRSIHNELTP
ncbi:MAG: hypothetical protein EOP84_24745 [Verrucomicrobiaceae bacterium]|nr:MAG: hypothetical protein EOP84_24745 [Verrucomicrobiaceae bacterium]